MRRVRLFKESKGPPEPPQLNQSGQDTLTGVLSRGVWERADPMWWRPGALVALLNVDRMIQFNAARGHLMGDHALRLIGSLLAIYSDEAGSQAHTFRIGGNEFAVVWHDATVESATSAVERVRATVEGTGLSLTVRIAVSIIREGETPQRVLIRFDGFMHEAGISRRNSVYTDPELSLSTLTIRDALLSCLCGQPWPEGPLLDALALSPALDVLDVGARDGRLLRLLRAQEHAGRLEGLDPVGGEGVRSGMAHALPYPDASFDVVLFVRALAHTGWPDTALREARRVLRPGGRLVVVAHGPEHLRATWRALGNADAPVKAAPEGMGIDVRLPVSVTGQDARALAQSSGGEQAVQEQRFPVRDTLHLTIQQQTL
ncbi:methyltransferase domain-containing protein [uncultured Deinococcus sp.]|uniref:methyltransferase domain-containing protein n=1 Tax=uncultured Deinococcus sp. TaxID=158789 RepID=UPI0025EA701E|nr:methyltransferase domain-containing protein [uncultured Deinococcus sp.]